MQRIIKLVRTGNYMKQDRTQSVQKLNQNRDGVRGQKSTIVKLFEQGKNIYW